MPQLPWLKVEIGHCANGLINLTVRQSPSDFIRQVEWSWLNSDSPAIDGGFIDPSGAFWALDQFGSGIDEII